MTRMDLALGRIARGTAPRSTYIAPKVRLEHRAEKWTRFSAPTMLSFKKKASDSIPKVESTFRSDALAPIPSWIQCVERLPDADIRQPLSIHCTMVEAEARRSIGGMRKVLAISASPICSARELPPTKTWIEPSSTR
jgi:hypothetical protein